jgi:hypothetical protein
MLMFTGQEQTMQGSITGWSAGIAISLVCLSQIAFAQVNCDAIPAGPARTDCYIGLSRVYQGQSDVAAGKARVKSDTARLQKLTGTISRSKALKHRRKKLSQ